MVKPQVAFVGLGVMGAPMAAHLVRAGYAVRVYNRTSEKAEAWARAHGGVAEKTPRTAAQGAAAVCVCVGNDDDLRAVTYGSDGILAGLEAGGLLIDHTTASADIAREIATKAEKSAVRFLDAPVSGGQVGAENGSLTIMVGGEPEAFEKGRPIMESYGRAVTLMGPSGAGQLTKMVNQIAIAGLVQGLAEALNFAEKAGLEPRKVVEVIGKGAAQSWQMDNRAKTMIDDQFDFGFAVDWMRKDLAICLAESRRNGAPLHVTALVDQFYAQIQQKGGGRWDTSSLIRLLRRQN